MFIQICDKTLYLFLVLIVQVLQRNSKTRKWILWNKFVWLSQFQWFSHNSILRFWTKITKMSSVEICPAKFSAHENFFLKLNDWQVSKWSSHWAEPFTSQCRKMVRHTLIILQQLLQDFWSVSDHFTTLRSKGLNFHIHPGCREMVSNKVHI